jgi:GT2 family glycosyltransferase
MRAALRESRGGESPARTPASAPLASVIVVCFNSQSTLARCLRHLFDQDHPNYEVIVVDDGSTDGTAAIAEAASADGALKLIRAKRNRGCPAARNLGLREARSEIVAFVDADGFAAPDWLSRLTASFAGGREIGGVASTVFFDDNPLVLNGAGGTVNRQGWAADLSMNESYEDVQIAQEALYPMGCGMAFRREVIDRVGPFDDRMLNYYDDVDYGIRIWRAGYRIAVAPGAWVDHLAVAGDSETKRLLCERHRMRVVLKHAPLAALAAWAACELRELRGAAPPRRRTKLLAAAWNVLHLPSLLAARRRLRGATPVPERLVDSSRGDAFPAGLALRMTPRPAGARGTVEMSDPRSEPQLLHGWFPLEHGEGRSYRWAGKHAAALIRASAPVARLRLDYAHVPVDLGGVNVSIRSAGGPDPLVPVWSGRLEWQYGARVIENHPLALPPGDYEVVVSADRGWDEPPLLQRSLALAVARVSFEARLEIAPGGLSMDSPAVEEQLVYGWFEPEHELKGAYRWAGRRAAALVRLPKPARGARIRYRLPPVDTGGLELTVCSLEGGALLKRTMRRVDSSWQVDAFPLELAPGDYLVSLEADAVWSNPHGRDPGLWPENRSLGFAVSSLSFEAPA